MQLLLKTVQDPNLQIFVFWSPILKYDYRSEGEDRAAEFYDRRMTQIWDTNGLTSYLYESVLKVPDIVWDAYLLYGKSAQWTSGPTAPDFWMHQRGEELPGPQLNIPVLTAKVREMLAAPAPK